MIALIAHARPEKVLSLHAPLHCLNWTGAGGLALAQVMARGDHYPIRANIDYPTPGSLGNYCGARGIDMVTVELTAASAVAGWAANRAALLAAIRFPPAPAGRVRR